MKLIFSCLLLTLCSTGAFAISCGNGRILYKGDSLSQVLEKCGKPAEQSTREKHLVQRLEYYKSRPGDVINSKIVFIFKNNKLVNIAVTGNSNTNCQAAQAVAQAGITTTVAPSVQTTCNTQAELNVTSTNFCGPVINLGDSAQYVQSTCGNPTFQQDSQNPDDTTTITQLEYPDNHMSLQFENNKLVDIVLH